MNETKQTHPGGQRVQRGRESPFSALTVREEPSKLIANQWGPSWPTNIHLFFLTAPNGSERGLHSAYDNGHVT